MVQLVSGRAREEDGEKGRSHPDPELPPLQSPIVSSPAV